MISDAVFKIKEAEAKSGEIVKDAIDKANSIISAAEKKGDEKYKTVLAEANKEKEVFLESVRKKAEEDSVSLDEEGKVELEGILNLTEKDFEKVVLKAVERIVN